MPDPIAPHFPPCTMPMASNDSGAAATADANANADPAAAAAADAEPHMGWHRLPAELVAHVGSFLPWQAVDALRQTHKRTRQALASCTVAARIGWRIACVSSLSMLRCAVRELRDPLFSDTRRAHVLGALAGCLPGLDGGMVPAARDVLIDGIAQLPVPLRGRPLVALMQGLARCQEPLSHGPGALPLWRAVQDLPPTQRAEPMIACLRLVPPTDPQTASQTAPRTQDAMPDVEQWIDEALHLPVPDRGAVLAQILRRFPFGRAAHGDDRVQRFLQAFAQLWMPNGEPSWTEQAALLTAFAQALNHHWEVGHVDEDPAAHDLWRPGAASERPLRRPPMRMGPDAGTRSAPRAAGRSAGPGGALRRSAGPHGMACR